MASPTGPSLCLEHRLQLLGYPQSKPLVSCFSSRNFTFLAGDLTASYTDFGKITLLCAICFFLFPTVSHFWDILNCHLHCCSEVVGTISWLFISFHLWQSLRFDSSLLNHLYINSLYVSPLHWRWNWFYVSCSPRYLGAIIWEEKKMFLLFILKLHI